MISQGLKIGIVGLRTRRRPLLDRLALVAEEGDVEVVEDLPGDVRLYVEYVLERAIIAVGPEVSAGLAIKQLSNNSNAVLRLLHAAFEDVSCS